MRLNLVFKPHTAALLAVAALSLAACDTGTVAPAPVPAPEGAAEPAAASETVTATAQTSWEWSGGDLQGWTVNLPDAVISWPGTGGLSLTAPAEPASPDLFIRSPLLSVAGKDYSRIAVDLEAVVSATDLDLAIYYATTEHGESFDYRGGPLDGTPFAAGERRVLIYDMLNQAAGAPDCMESTVTQLRFDLPQGANSNYIVHSIKLCPTEAADCG
jgi:hypothetical protein